LYEPTFQNLLPPAHVGSWLAYFSTLKMEAIRFTETSVHTRTTLRHIPENGVLQHIGVPVRIFAFKILMEKDLRANADPFRDVSKTIPRYYPTVRSP
jgi:hypothetical protein